MSWVSGVTGSDFKKRIVRVMPLGTGAKVLLAIAALVALGLPLSFGMLGPVHAQAQPAAEANHSIVGTWQGTLNPPNHKLRTVLKIEKSSTGKLTEMFYSIDQTGRGFPTTSVSFENGVLNFAIKSFDLTYTGKMSVAGNSISGASTQMGRSLPLVFERATPETEWTIPPPPPHIAPMSANANPSFEIATIKPTKPGTNGTYITVRGTNVVTVGFTLNDLVKFAYDVQDKQILNGPSWMNTDKFDINAKPNVPGMPSEQQMKGMIKKLLADRFQLKMHSDHKEMSAFVLNVAKGGPKMTKNSNKGGLPGLGFGPPTITFRVHNATMDDFTNTMQAVVLDRPVVNHTGLTGHWDFNLHWAPDATQFVSMGWKMPPPSTTAAAPPPLFTAIQEQLGLKLGVEKTSVPVLVVDHVEHPSAN